MQHYLQFGKDNRKKSAARPSSATLFSFYSIKPAERSCDRVGVCQLYNKE